MSETAESAQKDLSLFEDESGQAALSVFARLDDNLSKLEQNLERQFNDSHDEEDDAEEEEVKSTHSHTGSQSERESESETSATSSDSSGAETQEDFDALIAALNRHDALREEKKAQLRRSLVARRDARELSSSDEDERERETERLTERERETETEAAPHNFVGKIFDLIRTLQQREASPTVDEWDNDEDSGYITISLSQQEFVEFEESYAYRWFMERETEKEASQRRAREEADQRRRESLVQSVPPALPVPCSTTSNNSIADGQFGATVFPSSGRRQSVGEQRRSEIIGQHRLQGADGSTNYYFNLKVIFEPFRTGFEEHKDLKHPKGTVIAGRYEVYDVLGQAAFSTALQCIDLTAEEHESQWVCLKVIKNNKDFFDQSLDEIKLLQYINSHGDPDNHHVLRLIDFFYCKEHLFIVSELLKENLYEFGRYIRENMLEPYYTLPRLKRISKQVLEALSFIHSLKLIHCDVKPENIVIKSFSRCEVKLIDFGSSCFTTDHLTTYIQSRSYRAPEVIIGHPYDSRIDVWSVGAVLAELYTGYVLFQNDSVPTMLSRITGILGPFPKHVLQNGKDSGKYFTTSNIVYERDEEGAFHLIFPKQTNLASRMHFPHHHLPHNSNSYTSNGRRRTEKDREDEELFVDFVRCMLHLDPLKRVTAQEALRHPWLADADTVQFKEYVIGQPAQMYFQQDMDGKEDEEEDYDDEADDEMDEEDAEDMNIAYYDRADDEDEDTVTQDALSGFARSTVLSDAAEDEEEGEDERLSGAMTALSLDEDIAAFEAEQAREIAHV